MKAFFSEIESLLAENEPVVLATIVRHSGSTPRGAGSRMAVRKDGSIIGTIGGGIVEEMSRRKAGKMFEGPAMHLEKFELSNDIAAVSDMICGGDMDVLLERVEPGDSLQAMLPDLIEELDAGRPGVLITTINGETPARIMILASGETRGDFEPSGDLLTELRPTFPAVPTLFKDSDRTLFLEPLNGRPSLYLLGAGHVSRPTCEMGAMLGMRVVVMDDRDDFANAERFPRAEHIEVLEDFSDCFSRYPMTPDSRIVIVTRGHVHDKTVLAQALETEAGYIGMIGSSRKKKAIYDALLREGVTKEELDRVHCPIGLSIGAQTPEEIGVAIVGEIIQFGAKGKK